MRLALKNKFPLSPCLLAPLSKTHLFCVLSFAFCVFTLSACQVPTIPVAELSPQAQRVAHSLELWPEIPTGGSGLKRPFFATIHIVGKRTTASGVLDYHNPRDFRVTAVTEMGMILFDARMNWAGVTVLRQMPGLDKSVVAILIEDLARAFQLPDSLEGLGEKGTKLVLRQSLSDNTKITWLFDAQSGRLRQTDVDMGAFDTLHIEYQRYNSRGWPEEMAVTRKARFYNIAFTFTDNNNIAQHTRHENAQ